MTVSAKQIYSKYGKNRLDIQDNLDTQSPEVDVLGAQLKQIKDELEDELLEQESILDKLINGVSSLISSSASEHEITSYILGSNIEEHEVFFEKSKFQLPSLLNKEKSFLQFLVDNKVYSDKFRFKMAMLMYRDGNTSRIKTLKPRDESKNLAHAIVHYSYLQATALIDCDPQIIYESSLESRFIALGYKVATGESLSLKLNEATSQIKNHCNSNMVYSWLEPFLSKEVTEINKQLLVLLMTLPIVLGFLQKTRSADISDNNKDLLICYFSGIRSMFQAYFHYIIAQYMGHDWLVDKNLYDSKEIGLITKSPLIENGVFHDLLIDHINFTYNLKMTEFNKAPEKLIPYDLYHQVVSNLISVCIRFSIYLPEQVEKMSSHLAFCKDLGEKRYIDECNQYRTKIHSIMDFYKSTIPIDGKRDEILSNIFKHIESCLAHKNVSFRKLFVAFSSIDIDKVVASKKESELISKLIHDLKKSALEKIGVLDVSGANLILENINKNISVFHEKIDALTDTLKPLLSADIFDDNLLDCEFSQLKDELDELKSIHQHMVTEADEVAASLRLEINKINSELAHYKEKLDRLNAVQKTVFSESMEKILFEKSSAKDVVNAIKENYLNVVFSDGIDKILDDCKYDNPRKLFMYLHKICGEYYQKITNGVCDNEARTVLLSSYSAFESDSLLSNSKLSALREFSFNGSKILIDKHVTIGTSRDPRHTVQVYFKIIDGLVHIGYIGRHLPLD